MSNTAAAHSFEFGGFRLDAAQRRLFGPSGEPVPLPSRAFDVLLHMLERAGDLLDKAAILKAVWPTTVVEEGNLSQCIFALRKALGDTAAEHRFIVTVPGRGYQFVAKVQVVDESPTGEERAQREVVPTRASSSWNRSVAYVAGGGALLIALLLGYLFSRPADSSRQLRAKGEGTTVAIPATIAVLPFVDLSPNGDMEYFADGIAEELTNNLARVGDLRVIGRRSAFSFKGRKDDLHTIGKKLKVGNIIEGSVRKQGNRIRISAQLSRTSDGVSLWTETYDRKLDDVLDIESEIASEVLAALGPVVQQGNHSRNAALDGALTAHPGAYNAYLRGNFFFARQTAEDALRARDEFVRAVELDPQFALAHASLARVCEQLARLAVGDVEKNKTLAFASLERALKLNPAIGDIWWIKSRFVEGPSTPLSLRTGSMERALSLSPGDADAMVRLGDIYFRQGRRSEGLALVQRAYEVDPLWPQAVFWVAFAGYTYNGDREHALRLVTELEALAPADPRGPILRAWIAMNEGRALDWDRSMERAIAVAPRDETTHRYLATEYGDLGALDAALYHARIARLLAPQNAGGWYTAAHVLLHSGDFAGARPFVQEAMATRPGDYQAHFAQGELLYYTNDCPGAIQSLLVGMPSLGQPEAALDLMPHIERATVMVWCLRKTGNVSRAAEIARVFNRALAPPMVAGLYDGAYARMAAATSDRPALIAHLKALANTRASQLEFSRHEPMIQPYLKDPAVKALLDQLEVRRAEWRKILPKSSMRVSIPGIEEAK